MSLQTVRDLVRSYEGTPDGFLLDSRAAMLTVGDLRRLLEATDAAIAAGVVPTPDRMDYMGALIRAHCTHPLG